MTDKPTKAGQYIPPAFPLHNHGAQTLGMHLTGMTLRDYFAAKAPSPDDIWKSNYAKERGYRGEAKMLADWNYEYADAMLKAREA
jgi:hypothetical protein